MPFLMESSEFSSLERGLLQRGELLNALFKDLYGARRLLFDRIVPPEVVYGAQGFLRQCHNLPEHATVSYCSFRAILRAGPMARLWSSVTARRRPRVPAIRWKTALYFRAFPSLYRDSEVHRVAIFFRSLRKTLATLVRNGPKQPVVVLLSAQPKRNVF